MKSKIHFPSLDNPVLYIHTCIRTEDAMIDLIMNVTFCCGLIPAGN